MVSRVSRSAFASHRSQRRRSQLGGEAEVAQLGVAALGFGEEDIGPRVRREQLREGSQVGICLFLFFAVWLRQKDVGDFLDKLKSSTISET